MLSDILGRGQPRRNLLKVSSKAKGKPLIPVLGGSQLIGNRERSGEADSHPETQPGDSWRACGILNEDKIQIPYCSLRGLCVI